MAETVVLPLLEEHGSCPVCGERALRPLHVYEAGLHAEWFALRVALMGCSTCGIGFAHPLPDEEALDAYYHAQAEGWDGRVADDVAQAVLERKLVDKRARHRADLAHIEPYLRVIPGGERAALDFGCGVGACLDVLQQAGWQTFGIEPGETARRFVAQRHTVLDSVPAERTFELAVLHHVLEHLRDPLAVVSRIARVVKPGGYLLVAVPDAGGLGRHRRFTHVFKFPHTFMFTRSSLEALLGIAGFEIADSSQDGEGWPKTKEYELKCLARRVDGQVPPPPDPLAPLVEALRSYGEYELAERRRLKEEAVAARGKLRTRLRRALSKARGGGERRAPKF